MLLVSGVVRVEGEFEPHDVVSIADAEGREFARGIANCASAETVAHINRAGEDDAGAPKHATRASVLVTRDNIVILEGQPETVH